MKGGVGGPCCHCGATSSPCWRKGPEDKPILCNACGARYLVKRSLDGYMPGQKPSKHHADLSHYTSTSEPVTRKSVSRQPEKDGTRRKRQVVDRYDVEDLYHFKRTQRVHRAPVNISVNANLTGFEEISISLWKPASSSATNSSNSGKSSSDEPSTLDSFLGFGASNSVVQVDADNMVLAKTLAMLRQPGVETQADEAPDTGSRRRRKQRHPTAGATS